MYDFSFYELEALTEGVKNSMEHDWRQSRIIIASILNSNRKKGRRPIKEKDIIRLSDDADVNVDIDSSIDLLKKEKQKKNNGKRSKRHSKG